MKVDLVVVGSVAVSEKGELVSDITAKDSPLVKSLRFRNVQE